MVVQVVRLASCTWSYSAGVNVSREEMDCMSWSIESLAPFDMWGVCALRTNSSRTFWCFVVSLLLTVVVVAVVVLWSNNRI